MIKEEIVKHLICPKCKKKLQLIKEALKCISHHEYSIINGVAELLPDDFGCDFKATSDLYGKLWIEDFDDFTNNSPTHWHFDEMQKVIPQRMVSGSLGLEIGCGNGFDLISMAKENKNTQVCGMDISESVFFGQRYKRDLDNLTFLRASATHIPFEDNTFDFCYSYGVLHHLSDPYKGFQEIKRVLKPGAPFFLYLYEDHINQPLKYYPLKIISHIRRLSKKLTPAQLKIAATLCSPFIVVTLSWPSKILSKFKKTQSLATKIPFNFGKGLFSIKGDLYDRFGAPFEHRFNQNQLLRWYHELSFQNPFFTKLKNSAGWVTMAYKHQ